MTYRPPPMPRKSQRELRLEERTNGFYDCLYILETEWRATLEKDPRGWIAAAKNPSPESERLWSVIEKCQAKIRKDQDEYKDLLRKRTFALKD